MVARSPDTGQKSQYPADHGTDVGTEERCLGVGCHEPMDSHGKAVPANEGEENQAASAAVCGEEGVWNQVGSGVSIRPHQRTRSDALSLDWNDACGECRRKSAHRSVRDWDWAATRPKYP